MDHNRVHFLTSEEPIKVCQEEVIDEIVAISQNVTTQHEDFRLNQKEKEVLKLLP